MKKFILTIFAVLLLAGQSFAATPGYRSDPGVGDILGQGKYQSDAHRIFRMVRYIPATAHAGGATLAADSIVIWSLSADDGVTVTTSTTSYDSAVAGIIVQQALTSDTEGNTAAQDVGLVNWTWLQTYGKSQADFESANGIVAAGSALGISGTAGKVAKFLPSTSNAALNGNCGFFYDALAAGDSDVEVFLRCN